MSIWTRAKISTGQFVSKTPFPGAVGYIKFGKNYTYYSDTIDLKHHYSGLTEDQFKTVQRSLLVLFSRIIMKVWIPSESVAIIDFKQAVDYQEPVVKHSESANV